MDGDEDNDRELDDIEDDGEENLDNDNNFGDEEEEDENNNMNDNDGEGGPAFNRPRNNEEEEEELDEIDIENGDFPDFATSENKKLNEQIVSKKKMNKKVVSQIKDLSERLVVMQQHKKNVEQELKQTRMLIEEKNLQTKTEDHMKQIADRQIGRTQIEIEKVSKQYAEIQDRINEMQNHIYKGNERLDQLQLEKNWNKEELQQWRLASQQKEKDNQTIEKYKREDDVEIKKLNLKMEKLTMEVNHIQRDLETEMTETQAYQIELDKTAEEFKRQHEDRQKLCAQWDEAIQNIARRDQLVWEEGKKMAEIKLEISARQEDLQEMYKQLDKEKGDNKNAKDKVERRERRIIGKKNENEAKKQEYKNKKAEIKIFQNRLSAFATEMAAKKNRIASLQQEMLIKKQRLDNEQKKYKAQEILLENEMSLDPKIKLTQEQAEQLYKDKVAARGERDKTIRQKKELLFKESQELFKLRKQEADLYSNIQGTMAAIRNLQAHMNKLNHEYQRQQELLYNAEYQIQLMERRVNKAKGERTVQESSQIEKDTEMAEQECSKLKIEHHNLTKALKQLDDEQRNLDKDFIEKSEDKKKFKTLIEKLNLENDMTIMDLSKVVKNKEEHMVQHDIMKLEIKKIRDNLNAASDEVLDLENKKNQIELSMLEREREISVHHDVLLAQYKAAEAERYTIAKELNEQETKVKNLQIRYQALTQKNRKHGEDETTSEEHSQAYYLIKAAQEKEELQRKENELRAKKLKSQKELAALAKTLNHLKGRNHGITSFLKNKGASKEDFAAQSTLDEQYKASSDALIQKKNELDGIKKDYDSELQRISEVTAKLEQLIFHKKDVESQLDRIEKDINSQEEKKDRARKTVTQKMNAAKTKGIDLSDNNAHIIQAKLDNETNLTKAYFSALFELFNEYPELSGVLDPFMKDKKIELPSKPPSSIDIKSAKSSASNR